MYNYLCHAYAYSDFTLELAHLISARFVHKAVLLPDLNESHGDMFSIANHACRHISLPMGNQLNFGSLCLSFLKVLAMKGILLYQTSSI